MVAGEKVVASLEASELQVIRSRYSDALALEMEGYAEAPRPECPRRLPEQLGSDNPQQRAGLTRVLTNSLRSGGKRAPDGTVIAILCAKEQVHG